jgi:murein DD-endopeptidase MepM/ murein hydrolase activator NlpD
MTDNTEKKDKKQKRGLYFALAVCLVGIAIAGAATYSSVMDYVGGETSENTNVSSNISVSQGERTNEVNGEPEQSAADETIVESSEPSSEESAQQEAAEETSDEASDEQPTEDANTQTYTPSDSLRYPTESTEVLSAFSSELKYNPVMKDYRAHNGLDVKAEAGETVKSVGNGVVVSTRTDLLLGNVIEIEHGDCHVLYCGLGDTFLVDEGETVATGTAIGSVYSVPAETNEESHIHIEVLRDGEYVDPAEILSQEP